MTRNIYFSAQYKIYIDLEYMQYSKEKFYFMEISAILN